MRTRKTPNTDTFQTVRDRVNSLQLIPNNHTLRLCPDNFCEVLSVFTISGTKNSHFGALLQFFAQATTPQDLIMTLN